MPKVETSTNSGGTSYIFSNQTTNVSIGNRNKQGNTISSFHRFERETNSNSTESVSSRPKQRRVVKKLIRKRPLNGSNETLHSDHSFSINSFTENKSNDDKSPNQIRPHRRRVVVTKKRLLIKPTTTVEASISSSKRRRVVTVTKKRLLPKSTTNIESSSLKSEPSMTKLVTESSTAADSSTVADYSTVVDSTTKIDSSTIEEEIDPYTEDEEYDYEEEETQEDEPITSLGFETIFDTNFFILPSLSDASPSSLDITPELTPSPKTITPSPTISTTVLTDVVYETKTIETTRLRTYTFIVTRVNGNEQIVTSTTEVKPQVKTLTVTDAVTMTRTVTLDLMTLETLPLTPNASPEGSLHHTDTKANEGRKLKVNMEEPRYNLATRIMSNGVEVIVAGDKTTYPGEPNVRRILSTPNKPMTLAPSTLSDHMMMMLPQDDSGVADLSSSLYKNQFVTKTCLTTYTYLTTYLENGSTTISSHEQVVSNIATEERNSATKIVATPTANSGFTLTQNSNLATGVFHTTYTYLYTIMDDEQPLVITSKHTVANTVTAPDDYLSLLQPSEAATPVLDTNTYLSTVELTKTLSEGKEQKVISTSDVITQVVITESVPPKGTSVMTSYIALDVEDIHPTATREYTTTDVVKTYFVTYTYYNTYLENGKTIVKTNVSTASDIVTEKLYLNPKKQTTSLKNVIVTTPINSGAKTKAVDLEIYATKTYQTTYTYFTTFLQDSKNSKKSPIISSNTKTVENVVTEKLENSVLGSSLIHNLEQSLEKKSLKSIITTATLLTGEEIEITAVNKQEIKTTKTTINAPQSNALTQTSDTLEPSSPSVITGSTIIFLTDDDPFGNFITPTLSTKPTKINKSTIKNELGSLLSSEIVTDDQSIAENSQNYVTSILGSKTITSNGATIQAGEPVIVVNNKKGNSTVIPIADPNKKKSPNKNPGNKNSNKNSANKNTPNKNSATKPATNNVSNLLGSIDINSLNAFGNVLNKMAGLIQTNLQNNKRTDNKTLITTTPYHKAITKLPSSTTTRTTTNKVPLVDAQNRSPIYIPVGGFEDDILESAESQSVASYDLNLPPQLRPDTKWLEESTYKNPVVIGKPTHESPLVNGGIPISPGQVITANSDVIVGKPAILGPRLPTFNKNKGPHHEDGAPLGMKPPPPPPKRTWPKRQNDLFVNDPSSEIPPNKNYGSLLKVPAIPLQHFGEEQKHDTVPQYTNINIAPNNQGNIPNNFGHKIPNGNFDNNRGNGNVAQNNQNHASIKHDNQYINNQNNHGNKYEHHQGNIPHGNFVNIPNNNYNQNHGNVPNSNIPHGNIPHGNIPNGNIPHSNVLNGNIQHGDVRNGNTPYSNVPNNNYDLNGNIGIGSFEKVQGNIPNGNIPNRNFDNIHVNIPIGSFENLQANIPNNNYENVQYKLNVVENDKPEKIHTWVSTNVYNIQPTRPSNQDSPTIVFAKPVHEQNLKLPIGDPISLPEVIERSTGQHLLVNIQPSQVANVIIPHGSTTALIFGGASEPHKNGQYFDDPSPYPEPDINLGFQGQKNGVPHIPVYNQYAESNQKPVSGMINVDSQGHHGVDVNVPPLSFAHDINVHVPPISFGLINHGDEYSAHIINHGHHDGKLKQPVSHNIINNKDHRDNIQVPSKEPPHFNINHNNNNRPVSFNVQHHKVPPKYIDIHPNQGDINIKVSPQPLPNVPSQEHVVPNGIVLDASLDNKPHFSRPQRPDYHHPKHPYVFEKLTPPPNLKPHPRPNHSNHYTPNINPLEVMNPPPEVQPKPHNNHQIRTESYPKPVTIPLRYERPHSNIVTPIQHNHDISMFKPDDYSGEDLEDSKEDENEEGEVIQESKTRPLRPGQIPYEVLKINATTTTTFKPTTIITTRKPYSNKPTQKPTTNPYKKITSGTYQNIKPNPDNSRPFRPNQHDSINKLNNQHYYPRNKTTNRQNPYIPFGTILPTPNRNKPFIITPKPHVPIRTTTDYKIYSPHFSTSMPIGESILQQANLFVQPFRPTSMPVDSIDVSTTSKPLQPLHPLQPQFEVVHNVGSQTEQPFNSLHTKKPETGDKSTTQQTFSFSNKDVMTTEGNKNSKPFINNYNNNNVYKITEKPFENNDDLVHNNEPNNSKEKVDLFELTESYNPINFESIYTNHSRKPDLVVKEMEKLVPPKIEILDKETVKVPDIDMKPPKPILKPQPKPLPLIPVYDLTASANTPRPFFQTPSEEMKPPPVIVEFNTPSLHNEPVMGLTPPPISEPIEHPVSTHKPILAPVVEISTYRPSFVFPKTTKEVPPYNFETPLTTQSTVEITSKRITTPRTTSSRTTSVPTRAYTRYTTSLIPFVTTIRPIFRWTKPAKTTTTILIPKEPYTTSTENAKTSENISTVKQTSTSIKPTTVRKPKPPTMEVIIGHPTMHEITVSTTEKTLKEQNRNDKNPLEIKKPDVLKIKPSTTIKSKPSTKKSAATDTTIYNNLYTKDDIIPTTTRPQEYSTGIHHAGNEIKIIDDTTTSTQKLPKAPTQIKESKIILPTKYITHTQTLTVTTTKTTVVKSLGAPPSTLTLLITKTRTSTIVDTVTQTQTLVKPTSIIETVTTTINHTPVTEIPEVASTYPSFPVQATAILHPDVISSVINEDVDEDEDLDEFIIKDTDPPITKEETSSESAENESIFVVLTDKKPGVVKVPKLPKEHATGSAETVKVEDFDHPHRDEVLTNDVNRVLLGGILIASPPSLESPDIVPPGASNECRPDCKASRNELCQRVEGQMRCVCRPGFARMFPDRPCKPTYTYRLKIALSRFGKEMLQYKDTLADPTSPQYIRLAAATHNGLDRMVMQSDLRDIYHGVQVNGFEPNKGEGILNNFHVQLSENTDESRLKEVFKKYLRNSNYSLGGTEIYAAREYVEDLDALDFDECTNLKFHDCSEHAQCFNLKGTYTCSCREGFADLSENPLYPGRICSAELIGCERCHYHGTCYSRGDEQVLCECFQWYAGENCHINLKVLLIALVTLGAILFTLLLICIILTCVKRRRPQNTGIANGMSFLPHRPMVGRRTGTLDRRAMIQDTSSEGSDTLPYVQKKQKKLKGALKKPSHPDPENDASNISFVEQRDRSLTVMIPRAKYHPAPPTSPLLNITSFEKRKNSVASSNEAKLLSYLDAGPTPNKDNARRKHSHTPSESCLKGGRKISTGALVSAGFEVSATVGANNMGTLQTIATTCGTEADRSENATLIQKISADLLSSTGTTSQFTTLRKTIRNDDEDDPIDNWLDITPRVMTVSEARSYDETTIQPPTKSLRSGYDSKQSSQHHNNDEANTMAERDLGSTFLLPHTHLYKPDRGSDISGFDSL